MLLKLCNFDILDRCVNSLNDRCSKESLGALKTHFNTVFAVPVLACLEQNTSAPRSTLLANYDAAKAALPDMNKLVDNSFEG
jgi:hypothetical protein